MKSVWRVLMLATLVGAGCNGTDEAQPGKDPSNPNADPMAPCTDMSKCCTGSDQLVCTGEPDGNMVCTCRGLWDCAQNPRKCEQPMPTPPGGANWQCSWGEFNYTCSGTGDQNTNPQSLPGGSDWTCVWNNTEFKWDCKFNNGAPNPTNKPEGTSAWKCKIVTDDAGKPMLSCDRTDASQPPTGSGTWNCTTDAAGKTTCTKVDDNRGLPTGGSDWSCNRTTMNGVPTWVCYGKSDTPPGGSGWICSKVDEFNTWKCIRPETSGDTPTGGGWWACSKGTEFNGTTCVQVPTEPVPPSPTGNDVCAINTYMWCDGLEYCGWGMVDCDPATGKWRTKVNEAGQTVLDCRESLAGGKRPNTVCACYHFFFNPACCERPDCIVPPGTTGQICPASNGGLCDYCNPQASECKESGAKCIVTNSHETFCGRLCGASSPCPSGYTCMVVKLAGNQTTNQCVPADYSCYY